VDDSGNYLPHLLPVDQTLHWANPTQVCAHEMSGTDCEGVDQGPYTGPVPIVTHLHGAHVEEHSDGYPTSWYLPAANDVPEGYATIGSRFADSGIERGLGYVVYEYRNDQRATTLWYHDHTLGITRLNVYAGPVGFYLLRGGDRDLTDGELPSGSYEIPFAIQDKSFNEDGSLFFPDHRAFFEGLEADQLQIPFTPDLTRQGERSDVARIWNPEFFGNTMVVNGKTWPYLNVEPRRYRFRFLNGSDSRFVILKNDNDLPFWQIGSDGGFLPQPVELGQLLLGPAERADVIVDFSGLAAGTEVTLLNLGPDEPFGGGEPGVDFDPADPGTTGQVMQFRVIEA
jgi:spore coat protein A, manganese oxidase